MQAQGEIEDVWYRSDRQIVRRLRLDDIGEAYASWFGDDAVRAFIKFARSAPSVDDLRAYWREKTADPGVDFLGIFEAQSGRHLGNIKFEIGPRAIETHVGFMIGSAGDRRRGLLREALPACVERLRRDRGPLIVYLTVDPKNGAALSAFSRLGFCATGARAQNGDLRMDYAHE
jgi:[ribosomal protein S5]-alanine N-acetyltransferase